MKSKEEQRAEIRFCVRSGMSPTETFARLKNIHGNNCLSRSSVFRWHQTLRSGGGIQDKVKQVQLRKVTPAKVDQLLRAVEEDRRQSVPQLARRVGLSVGSTHTALHKKLGMRKAPSRWIPHLLTAQEKFSRLVRA